MDISSIDREIRLATKFSHIPELARLISDKETEWAAIVLIQNGLDEVGLGRYIHALDKLGCSLVSATIEQRIKAFVNSKSS